MKKRLLSISLTLCMIVANISALGVFALAEEVTDNSAAPEVAEVQAQAEETAGEEVTEEENSAELSSEEDASALSDDGVKYLSPKYRSGYSRDYLNGFEEKTCTNYTLLSGDNTTLKSGFYVARGSAELGGTVMRVQGEVKIILEDGCNWKLNRIVVNEGNSLEIFAQEAGTGTLRCEASSSSAIGSESEKLSSGKYTNVPNGPITINGGHITAIATDWAAAIGSAGGSSASEITINGGDVYAKGDTGIGGGTNGSAYGIYINGGHVEARSDGMGSGIGGGYCAPGQYIYINNAKVEAYGRAENNSNGQKGNGAGIGGGAYSYGYSIHIENNSVVTAEGGQSGCGIGGAARGLTSGTSGDHIYIENSEVTAKGHDDAAAIGGAEDGIGEYIYITNSTVRASLVSDDVYSAAAIGGGENSDGRHIYITKSDVTAYGGNRGAGIGGGDGSNTNRDGGDGSDIVITDSVVTAHGGWYGGAGIGGGNYGNGKDITILRSTITEARGRNGGAGIGSGDNAHASDREGKLGYGDNINIIDSVVTAYGSESGGGAGIGGGWNASGENITIQNSKVYAYGGDDSPGIGGGGGRDRADGKYITILNSEVTAKGLNEGAGIGGGDNTAGMYITIKEENPTTYKTKVTAYGGGSGGSGIGGGDDGGGYHITLDGGEVNAYGGGKGSGIGGGWDNHGEVINIKNTKVYAVGGVSSADGIGSAKGGGYSSQIYFNTTDYDLVFNGRSVQYGTGDMASRLYDVHEVRYEPRTQQSGKHSHKWSYKAEGGIIYASCKAGGHKTNSTEFVELVAPESCVYDGKAKEVTINGTINGVKTPAVKYYKGSKALKKAPSAVGTYTAKITLGKTTASLTYTIAKAEDFEKYNDQVKLIGAVNPVQNAALAAKNGKITVSWAAPEVEDSEKAAADKCELSSYEIYRATSENGKYTKVGTVKAGTLKYVNAKNLKKGKTYYYKVRGVAKFGALTAYTDWSDVQYAKCIKTVK